MNTAPLARHRIEEEFHDRAARREQDDFWSFGALDEPDAYHWETLGDLRGKKVLEIGCGDGSVTVKLAKAGALVTAIDISGEMVAVTAERIAREGLTDDVTVIQQSAEELDLEPESFDVVYGHAVLHHLDQSIVIPKIASILRAGGCASFLDPLDHNLVLNFMRRLTPEMRTPTEKPISYPEIDSMSRHFGSTKTKEFHLVALASYFWFYVIKNRRLFRTSIAWLSVIDRALFASLPVLRRYAWVTVITFRK